MGEIVQLGECEKENCPGNIQGEYLDPHAALQVSIQVAVMIYATVVNKQIQPTELTKKT